jgi:hypothetical protein
MKMTKNKWLLVLGVVIAIALAIGIGVSAAAAAKERKRLQNIAEGKGPDGKGGFNPRPYTDALFLECYSNSYADKTLFAELLKMPDQNIRDIFVDWETRYKSKKENEGRTLGKAIKYAYSGYFVSPFAYALAMEFHNKLVQLGLE